MSKVLTIVIAIAMGGCAGSVPAPQPVQITASDFCRIVDEKLTWDVRDTPETIRGVRRLNAKWDARCGRPTS